MKKLILLSALIHLVSCNFGGDQPPKNLNYKILNEENFRLDWFFYSTITTESPDFVTLTSLKNDNTIDTVYCGNNLYNVTIQNDTIKFHFWRSPHGFSDFELLKSKYRLTVIVDTNENNYKIKKPKYI